jgi:hypothetical protein
MHCHALPWQHVSAASALCPAGSSRAFAPVRAQALGVLRSAAMQDKQVLQLLAGHGVAVQHLLYTASAPSSKAGSSSSTCGEQAAGSSAADSTSAGTDQGPGASSSSSSAAAGSSSSSSSSSSSAASVSDVVSTVLCIELLAALLKEGLAVDLIVQHAW